MTELTSEVEEVLRMLPRRRRLNAPILADLPLLEQVLVIPEAFGFIVGCSDQYREDIPLVLRWALNWSVQVWAVRQDVQHKTTLEGPPRADKLQVTHVPAIEDSYKLLCGLLYAGSLSKEPPYWVEPLVQQEEWPSIIEWALAMASGTGSHVLTDIWKVNPETELYPWFREVCETELRRLGELRYLR